MAALAMVSVASRAEHRAEREHGGEQRPASAATATAISAPGAQSGRVRNLPLRIWSMISACTSTPGTAAESGVATMSRRPTALVPISTMRPATRSA